MYSISAVIVKREGLYLRKRVPITSQSSLVFHPLRWSNFLNHYMQYGLVRVDTDESILVYPEQLKIISLLYSGKSVGEVAAITGFDLDTITTLIGSLVKSGYVAKIDSQTVFDGYTKIRPWFVSVDRKWFRWVLWKPLLILEFIYIVSGLLLGVFYPSYIPRFSDFFWHSDIFVVVVLSFICSMTLTILHEWMHFFFTKAVGGEARIQFFGNRFFDFVFETYNYYLELVPRKLRYFVYIGGMLSDFLVIATVLWIFVLCDHWGIDMGIIRGFLKSVMLIQIMGIIWQFNVYLQTDVYNFFSDFFGQENLYPNAMKFIGLKIKRLAIPRFIKNGLQRIFYTKDIVSAADDLRSFSHSDRRLLIVYSALIVGGLSLTLLNILLFSLPRDLSFVFISFVRMLESSSTGNALEALKYLVALILSLYANIAVIILVINKIMHKYSFV